MQTGSRTRTDPVKTPKVLPSRVEFVRNQDTAQVDVIAALRAPGKEHKNYMALRVLEQVLHGGMAARVQQRIREPGLAYHAAAAYDVVDDCGLFEVSAGTSPDKLRELVDGLLGLLSDSCQISEDEFALAKKQVGWNMDRIEDMPMHLADTLGIIVNRGKKPDFQRRREELQKITLDDLQDAAKAMVTDRHLYMVCIGPVTSSDKTAIKNKVRAFAGANYSG